MLDDFRSRMGELREEIDRWTSQAEELERVVQDQQVRLEEMDLLVRQRDEQLAEQQARVEELDEALRQREKELTELRTRLDEREETLSKQDESLEDLRSQLIKREATETVLRERLAQAEAQLAEQAAPPKEAVDQALLERFSTLDETVQQVDHTFLERFTALDEMVQKNGQVLSSVQTLIEQQLSQLQERLARMEADLRAVPPPLPAEAVPPPEEVPPPEAKEEEAPPEEVAPPEAEEVEAPPEEEAPPEAEEVEAPPEEEAPPEVEEVEAPPEEEAPPEVEVVEAPPKDVARLVDDPVQVLLHEALEMLPDASLVGFAGSDGLGVGFAARGQRDPDQPLEVELADLTLDARRISQTLGSGPLVTLAFQTGEQHYLISPVSADYFAFMLAPAGSTAEFRQAQATLLQVASQLSEFL
jgi:hypothetical protein